MNENTRSYGVARGIIHCHTDASYDSSIQLEELCYVLKSSGFDFVALTEHTKNLTSERYHELVHACEALSSSSFLVIPGLEIKLDDGTEIAGIGIDQLIHETSFGPVVDQIRNMGGYAIWVHPRKRQHHVVIADYDCDAIEIMNGKIDGTTAPNLSLLWQVRRARRGGKDVHAIFGPDLHVLGPPLSVWTECLVSELTRTAIVHELRQGRFVNYSSRLRITSLGSTSIYGFFLLLALRCSYLGWNKLLSVTPPVISNSLIRNSRRIVNLLKCRPRSKIFPGE